MSLHKYLFANSNPVMYSDPSGHMSKAESIAVVTVMSVLAAEMNGILYVFKLDDNDTYLSKNDFYKGLWKSMLTAFVISFISGIITIFLGCIVGPFLIALIGGIVGLGLSFKAICQGVVDIINGKFKSGVMEIAFGIIGATASATSIYFGIEGIVSSSNSSSNNVTINDSNQPIKDTSSASDPNRISDNAHVVRGGTNTAERFTNGSGVTTDSDGILDGVSVNSKDGLSVKQLSEGIPNKQIGITTAGKVRAAGGDVVPSPTKNNPNHATLSGITAEMAEQLFTPTYRNPFIKT